MYNHDMFWYAPLRSLKKGYAVNKSGEYICLICGKRYTRGTVYNIAGQLFLSKYAVKKHVSAEHGTVFEYLLGMGKSYTGLTDKQREIIRMFFDGLSDKEIAEKTGAANTSTIRNARFAFKEKYKQAKITVALYELLDDAKHRKSMDTSDSFVDFHRTASAIDERFAITEAERGEVLGRYFDADNNLIIKNFPAREKKKIIILQRIIESFEWGKIYSEKEVNMIIKGFYEDIASIRRCMIEYGFLDRSKDGKEYWIKR